MIILWSIEEKIALIFASKFYQFNTNGIFSLAWCLCSFFFFFAVLYNIFRLLLELSFSLEFSLELSFSLEFKMQLVISSSIFTYFSNAFEISATNYDCEDDSGLTKDQKDVEFRLSNDKKSSEEISSDDNIATVAVDSATNVNENNVVPKAAFRKRKNSKKTNNYVYVSIGNTPSTVSKSLSVPQSKSSTLRSTNSASSPLTFSKLPNAKLATNSSVDHSSPDMTIPRAPHGMRLRIFLPPIRYPSLSLLPSDEFSSQASDREYQNAEEAIPNRQNNFTDYGQNTQLTTAIEDAPAPDEGMDEENQRVDFKEREGPANEEIAHGRCKALYDYDANMYDELTIRTGEQSLE